MALPNTDPKAPTAYIALSDVGDVKLESGAAYIYRENSQRFIPLKYSVRGRDLGSTVAEAQERVAENVPLPPGYRMEWAGEFGALVEAKKRLAVIVPLSLLLILMLLYSLFNSVRDSLLALSGIPFAVAGGILGLYVAGLNASVSAAVGFISLFGVSAMDGILLVSYIRRNMDEGMETESAIIHAGETRMRQIFMTGLSACIGLVPAALSTGIGSQVQQPLACVIVGGMLLSPICSLLVIPTLARLTLPDVPDERVMDPPHAESASGRALIVAARWPLLSGRRAQAAPGVADLVVMYFGCVVGRGQAERLHVETSDRAEQGVSGDHPVSLCPDLARACRHQILLRIENVERRALPALRLLLHAGQRDSGGANLGFGGVESRSWRLRTSPRRPGRRSVPDREPAAARCGSASPTPSTA